VGTVSLFIFYLSKEQGTAKFFYERKIIIFFRFFLGGNTQWCIQRGLGVF